MARIARTFRTTLVATLFLSPFLLRAQGVTVAPATGPAASASSGSPAITASRAPLAQPVGVRALRPAPAPVPAPNPFSVLTPEGKMVWGGAAIVVGALVGGDTGKLIELGGAGIGLWGLFQFLK